jgi:hypothetical protein
MAAENRFERFLDPFGGWLVWDYHSDAPAEPGGRLLMGIAKPQAELACALLNSKMPRFVADVTIE